MMKHEEAIQAIYSRLSLLMTNLREEREYDELKRRELRGRIESLEKTKLKLVLDQQNAE